MESAGFYMLALVAILLLGTGLPVFVVLIGVSVLFAGLGIAAGAVSYDLLTALPPRIIGILETDIVQALPLYVLMGALLNRLPFADTLFRTGAAAFSRTAAAPLLSAVGLGAMLAPMNGSVGASVATLSRIVQPKLDARGVAPAQGLAVICVASTLGVVVPPSLVLILLGDAMLRADTEAINATGRLVRAINTQDVFRGALGPAAIFLALSFILTWWMGRKQPPPPAAAAVTEPVDWRDWAVAIATVAFIVGLLAAVVAGYVYAVEAAASGALAIFVIGLVTRSLSVEILRVVLRDTMAVTGALFALFVAATSFTLVIRAFGTDRLLAELVAQIPGGPLGAVIVVQIVLAICAFVLDAYEVIFVVIPLLMPPLLIRAPDAVWVSALTLLALQASFLIPPLGLSVMMARSVTPRDVASGRLMRAIAPFLVAQLVVVGLVLAFPRLAHVADEATATRPPAPARMPDFAPPPPADLPDELRPPPNRR